MNSPGDKALDTLAALAKSGKVSIGRNGDKAVVSFSGRLSGQAVQLNAVEPTLIEACIVIGRQATGRKPSPQG